MPPRSSPTAPEEPAPGLGHRRGGSPSGVASAPRLGEVRIEGSGGGTPSGPGEPVGRASGTAEERRATRSTVLATGTLACPSCDAPVSPGGRALRPAEPMRCPVCARAGAVRDFLSLATPARPARVRVVVRGLDVRVRSAD